MKSKKKGRSVRGLCAGRSVLTGGKRRGWWRGGGCSAGVAAGGGHVAERGSGTGAQEAADGSGRDRVRAIWPVGCLEGQGRRHRLYGEGVSERRQRRGMSRMSWMSTADGGGKGGGNGGRREK